MSGCRQHDGGVTTGVRRDFQRCFLRHIPFIHYTLLLMTGGTMRNKEKIMHPFSLTIRNQKSFEESAGPSFLSSFPASFRNPNKNNINIMHAV